ncbi:hypothetical protein TNIN_277481, partial [Trichonephila inaurata madagascariensis]
MENKNKHENSQPELKVELTKPDKKEDLEETKELTIEVIGKVRVIEETTPETMENPPVISDRNEI